MSEAIVFHGLEAAEETLLRHAPHLDYVLLVEVITRLKRTPLARVRFTPDELSEWLESGPDEEETEEDTSDQPTVEGPSGLPWGRRRGAARSELALATEDEGPEEEEINEDEAPEEDEAPTWRQMCRAVMRWVRHEAREVVQDRPICTLRLMMYRPKGEYVESKNFKVENHAYLTPQARRAQVAPVEPPPPASPPPLPSSAPPAPSPPPPPPPPPPVPPPAAPVIVQLPALAPPPAPLQPLQVVLPTPPTPEPPRSAPAFALALSGGEGQILFLDPETIPEARVWRALGLATEDLLRRSGVAYGNIIELQSRTVLHQASQLDKSNALIESLATQLLAARQVQAADESEQKVDERQLRVREELGKTFLSELGSLGRVLASSKLGLSPELAELGDLVAGSPELAEALREPQVRALLKNEETRKELAHILRFAASRTSGGGTPPQAA